MKLLYVAPYQDFSGYAQASRDYIHALSAQPDIDVVCRALKYDKGNYYYGDVIAENECKDLNNIDVVVQHTTPNETSVIKGVPNINYFAWETNKISKEWIDANKDFNLLLMPCEDNIKAYHAGGGEVPIKKLVHTFNLDKYEQAQLPFLMPQAEGKMKFYTICQLSKKKGVEAMVRAFYRAFDGCDDVMFVMKMYQDAQNKEDETKKIHQYLGYIKQMTKHDRHPPIFPIIQIMSGDEINRLHTSCDVYVATSRAEGFNIPAFDAMAFGNPVIATNWGGMTEFIDNDNGWLVNYTMSPCFAMNHPIPHMYTSNEDWAEPDVLDIVDKMKEAYDLWSKDKLSEKGDIGKKKAKEFSYDKVGKVMADYIREVIE